MTGTDNASLVPLTVDDPAEIGAFRLIGRLGAGGMGVVYFGRDASGHPAAIKMIRGEYAADPGYRARFEKEVHLAQRVRGRCIVPLLAADTAAEWPWLAAAYAAGPTLRGYVAELAPLRGSALTAFAAGFAEALAAIHREGIVHRDLKPENVILSPEGPKVLDFGIAQALDDVSMTRTDMVVGTPGWISPERYDGERAGPASDMFCWGGLVAYAASGRPPYGAGPMEMLRYRTINEEPDTAEGELPPALHDVVRRALDRSPENRPAAAEAFAAITGEAVAEKESAEHLTRAATRLIDAEWTLSVTDDSTRFPTGPLRATTARRPITFAGRSVHAAAELARLFDRHATRAENWLCRGGAGKLRDWLDDTGDTAFDRDYLSGVDSREQAATAITAFIAAQLPDERPRYRGRDAGIEGLRELARGGAEEHQMLAEIIVNEIPLIAAGHRCSHEGCAARCARLERVGHRARSVIDGALITASKAGFRPAPAERDRAVAIAVEAIDDPGRRATVRVVLQAWAALILPWWRALAFDALTVAPGGESQQQPVAARLLAPFARSSALHEWRRLLSPRTWFHRASPRILVPSFLFWAVATFVLVLPYSFGEAGIGHPAAPGASQQAAALAHQMELWPIHLVLALALALAPERSRPGTFMFASGLAALLSYAPFLLGNAPMLVPDPVREPLISGMDSLGEDAAILLLGALPAGFALFVWVLVAVNRSHHPPHSRPLLPGQGPAVRAAAAVLGLSLVVWGAVWSLAVVTGALVMGAQNPPPLEDLRSAYTFVTSVLPPLSLLIGVAAYTLWGRFGGHLLWVAVLALTLLMDPLSEMEGLPVPGAGEFTAGLLEDEPGRTGWTVLLVLLPGVYVFGTWLSTRLRYRRTPPHTTAPPPQPGHTYPSAGYPPPAPGYGPPPGYHGPGHPAPSLGVPAPGPPVTGPPPSSPTPP
ncbi:serine/threonine-protein kinase, partial [Allosalinactinospora lopnorensis]|uniref:serine/threonine-protein kinase n=1 Tax=Allosalinactinospora lopnorensis TaxID=1352348 RepID=UPI000ADF6AAC